MKRRPLKYSISSTSQVPRSTFASFRLFFYRAPLFLLPQYRRSLQEWQKNIFPGSWSLLLLLLLIVLSLLHLLIIAPYSSSFLDEAHCQNVSHTFLLNSLKMFHYLRTQRFLVVFIFPFYSLHLAGVCLLFLLYLTLCGGRRFYV